MNLPMAQRLAALNHRLSKTVKTTSAPSSFSGVSSLANALEQALTSSGRNERERVCERVKRERRRVL